METKILNAVRRFGRPVTNLEVVNALGIAERYARADWARKVAELGDAGTLVRTWDVDGMPHYALPR